jgi:hypothetical protein
MKNWLKILIVCVSGALVWGLSFIGTLESMQNYAMAISLFCGATAALCATITGFAPKST